MRGAFVVVGRVAALFLIAAAPCVPAAAQHSSGAIVGRVVDRQSRTPVPSARITLLGTSHALASDGAGRFRQDSLESGTYRLQVRALGYAVGSWVIKLRDGEERSEELALEPLPVPLEPVTVEGQQAFERRRASGRGHFITENEIAQAHPRTLGDLFRNVPGVRMQCRGMNCTLRMIRAPRGCAPDFIMDGFPATNATSLDMPTIGIIGIEVYRTLSETPMEFLRADNQCGTIVIWTRSGPG
jgi:carboxypeptidase family protein